MDNEKNISGLKGWLIRHKPSKRRLIQVYAALLYNANIKGFATGEIYKGNTKNFCVPGLNCYSCPGAVGACPLGSLQNALASGKTSSLAYIFGILILFGLLLGRTICGFLCPFGLVQELLHKIPSPKLKKSKVTRVLSYFKYVLLGGLVVLVTSAFAGNKIVPAFCKYVCPDGILFGAFGLLIHPNNADKFGMLGPLFTWKFCLLVVFIVGSVFIYRFFCRFFCPLGAIYGFFCKVAMLGVKLDEDKCVSCGKCVEQCQMDIRHVGDHECIHCGKCIDVCPTKAIRWSGSKFFVADPTSGLKKDATEEEITQVKAHNAKLQKRRKVCQIVAAVLAVALLAGALVYYNFMDTSSSNVSSSKGEYGNREDQLCYDFTLPIVESDKTFNLFANKGKITVINFWASWCGPCKEELPEFNELAGDFAEQVDIIAISTDADDYFQNEAMEFIHSQDMSNLLFAFDSEEASNGQTVGKALNIPSTLPVTFVVDQNGKIIFYKSGSMSYDELLAAIAPALSLE